MQVVAASHVQAGQRVATSGRELLQREWARRYSFPKRCQRFWLPSLQRLRIAGEHDFLGQVLAGEYWGTLLLELRYIGGCDTVAAKAHWRRSISRL